MICEFVYDLLYGTKCLRNRHNQTIVCILVRSTIPHFDLSHLTLLNAFGVGVSCRKLYSFVVYLYVNGSGSITSVGEERANLSAVVYL